MSCHSTPGNSAVTSVACALTHTPSDEVARKFHALKTDTPADFQPPTLEEAKTWLNTLRLSVKIDDTLTAWRQERLLQKIFEAENSLEENLPNAATWYAWQNLRSACEDVQTHEWLIESAGLEMPISEAKPASIDEKLSEEWNKIYALTDRKIKLVKDYEYAKSNRSRFHVDEKYLTRKQEAILENQKEIDKAVEGTEIYESEYQRRGGWARYFRVVTNGEGHVHSSMSCHSCYPTTRYVWLPTLSGKGEEEAVDSYGKEMCSHCFPNVLSHPSYQTRGRISEELRTERAAVQAERNAASAAKNITLPNGQPLKIGLQERYPETIRTAVTAERTAVSYLADIRSTYSDTGIAKMLEMYPSDRDEERKEFFKKRSSSLQTDVNILIEALAAKRNTDKDSILLELTRKADAKIRREKR